MMGLKIVLFIFILYLVTFLFADKIALKKKVISFERGFVNVGKIQVSYSIHFFLIIVIFIIFDLEIVLMLGFIIFTNLNLSIGFLL
jgi:NADH-ubiquinone oxidoreductase chain 3